MTLPDTDVRAFEAGGPAAGTTRRIPRMPALDGLRAVALGAVLLFHSNYVWARGGHLGVTAFFTLSGFLITTLLLLEHDAHGRIDLVAFWGRRARRLVPAALVCVGLVAVYVAASPDLTFDGLLGDAAASVTWLANWRFVAEGEAYSDLFSVPSPFQHFWSLAIEEQFYLALPILAVFALRVRRSRRLWLASGALALVAASTTLAVVLHQPGQPPLRAYYGTDTRIAEPLVGVVLALLLVGPTGVRRFSLRARRGADIAGVVALVGLGFLASTMATSDTRLYEGGFLLAAVLTAFVVMAATQRGGVIDRMLSAPILQGIGRISYGGYLFHWPIYLWFTESRTGLEGIRLLTLRVVLTLTLAGISYVAIELPVRERRLFAPRVGAVAWANGTIALLGALVLSSSGQLPAADATENSRSFGSYVGALPEGGTESAADASSDAMTSQGSSPAEVSRTSEARPPGEAHGAAAAPEGTDASTGQTTQSTAPAAPVEPDIRVAVIGDSLAGNLGRGFEIWAEQTGEVAAATFSISACPISRGGSRRFPDGYEWVIKPECSWWAAKWREEYVAFREFAPDVVVVQDSFSVLPDRKQPEWPRYMKPGEPFLDTWLIGQYSEFIDAMAEDAGAAVVVTNAVCADYGRRTHWNSLSDADERVRALNRQVYPALSTKARVADLSERVCPDGNYTNSIEGYDNARPDGFHLRDEVSAALVSRWLGPIAVSAADGS